MVERIALRSSLVLPAAFLAFSCSLHFIEPQLDEHLQSEHDRRLLVHGGGEETRRIAIAAVRELVG